MPELINITTNEDYFYRVIELNNGPALGDTIEYFLEMPQSVGLNFKYSEMCFDVKTSIDYTGNVYFDFMQNFTDSNSAEHEIPVPVEMVQDKSITVTQLTESNNGQTWKLRDASLKNLRIRLTQQASGTGWIFLIIRATI